MAIPTAYDVITTSELPDALRIIYSNELEFTARPVLVTDQPAFVEPWEEFGAKRGAVVTRTVYHQLPRAIATLVENQDVNGGSVVDHQVSMRINEHGYAIGTSETLDLLSYQGPISNVVTTLLGPQMALSMDTLARNALWYGQPGFVTPSYKTYDNNPAVVDRWHLTSTDTMSSSIVQAIAYRLGVRQVPTLLSGAEPCYIAITHDSPLYDLRNDNFWINAQQYAGATRLFNGEVGMIHGVRFIKSANHRVPNGGALNFQVTIAPGVYGPNQNTVTLTSNPGFTAGMEISLHNTGTAVTAPPAGGGAAVSWVSPNGQDPTEETLVISSVNGNILTLADPMQLTHNGGDYCTEALDIYPVTFAGGVAPLAKGVALEPEVRVALPTDKLRRMSYIGWYTLSDYGIQRPWAYEICEMTGSQNVAPAYPI